MNGLNMSHIMTKYTFPQGPVATCPRTSLGCVGIRFDDGIPLTVLPRTKKESL